MKKLYFVKSMHANLSPFSMVRHFSKIHLTEDICNNRYRWFGKNVVDPAPQRLVTWLDIWCDSQFAAGFGAGLAVMAVIVIAGTMIFSW